MTLSAIRPAVKTRTRKPFAAGLVDVEMTPRANLLEMTAADRVSLYGPLEPLPIEPDEPGASSRLPRIDGHGLTDAEFRRMNGRRNDARYEYARDMPEATPGEIDAVGDRAASDALRAILRDRQPAPEPAPVAAVATAIVATVAGDVEYDSAADWPTWTDEDVWQLGPEDQGGDDEPDDDRAHASTSFEPSRQDRVWWCENAPSARRRVLAPHSDRDMRRLGACG